MSGTVLPRIVRKFQKFHKPSLQHISLYVIELMWSQVKRVMWQDVRKLPSYVTCACSSTWHYQRSLWQATKEILICRKRRTDDVGVGWFQWYQLNNKRWWWRRQRVKTDHLSQVPNPITALSDFSYTNVDYCIQTFWHCIILVSKRGVICNKKYILF
jgi:hypothetical protein